MRAKLLINDVHLGVERNAGTTPRSAFALGQYLLDSLAKLLAQHPDKDLVVNGDLFDQFSISETIFLLAFGIFANWLDRSEGDLVLVPGNHDMAKDDSRRSSFDVLAVTLQCAYPDRVKVVREPGEVWPGHYFIPHMANQELFGAAIAAVPRVDQFELDMTYLYLHCNYDNGFAAQSDHSLNISYDQARELVVKGWHLLIAHEHQKKEYKGITICGNQWPSSIADCLDNPDGKKYAHIITRDGVTPVLTWHAAHSFRQVSVDEIASTPITGIDFIRVTGLIPKERSSEVLGLVARLRQKSGAYVITSVVKTEGMEEVEELDTDDLQSVDVLKYLFEQLNEEQVAAVKALLEKGNDVPA